MERWEHFSQAYDNWADVQRDLAALGEGGWEAVSLVPVVLQARPLSPPVMHFYLIMKRRVPEQPDGEWPRQHLVPNGGR
jgi:hypothetical protein